MPTTIPSTTSSTRPGSPSTGDAYFETDTDKFIIYDGAGWRAFNNDGFAGITNNFSGFFDASDDALSIGNVTNLNSADNFSISIWYFRMFPTTGALFGGTGATGIGVYPYTSTDLYAHAGSVATIHNNSGPISAQWVHLVLTYDSSANTILYINGSATNTVSSQTIPSTAGNDFRIGSYTNYGMYYGGLLDDAAIWDSTTLNASNVSAIYSQGGVSNLAVNRGNYTQSGNLTHWYRMGDDSADTGSGGVSNGNTITNIENSANPGTNDASTILGAPEFRTVVVN